LSPRAYALLQELQEIAGSRTWCRPSIIRLSKNLDVCSRTVYRALAELEKRGYIESDDPNGTTTTIRRFLRVTETPAEHSLVSPMLELEDSLTPHVLTCEAPRDTASEGEGTEATFVSVEEVKPVTLDREWK